MMIHPNPKSDCTAFAFSSWLLEVPPKDGRTEVAGFYEPIFDKRRDWDHTIMQPVK